jgi:predicted RNase H-like HicB family nuclease
VFLGRFLFLWLVGFVSSGSYSYPSTREARSFEAGRAEESMKRYAIVVEKGPTSHGAYVPDLPGCVAAGETRAEVLRLIREAIEFHVETMREDGLAVPEPSSSAEYVEVPLV